MKLSKEFNARLMALKTSGKKIQYQQAWMVIGENEAGMDISKGFRPDSRIPNCRKYELPEGYRIVFQKIEGLEEHLALFVGTHAEVDHYLDSHKGWIFDPVKHTLKELRFNTATEDVNNIVRSPELQARQVAPVPDQPVAFEDLSDEQLTRSGLTSDLLAIARSIKEPDSIEAMQLLANIPQESADILLSYITGSRDERAEISALLNGERAQVGCLREAQLTAIEEESDQFIDIRDLPAEQAAFTDMLFEDWMLYLHPDQKALVKRVFSGAARLRGVSGSGKTVVAIHRARAAARRNLFAGTSDKVLFITYNRSLAELVRKLIRKLCTAQECELIEVSTHGRWCIDYLRFRTGSAMAWQDATRDKIWVDAVTRYLPKLHQYGLCMQVSSREQVNTKDEDIQFLVDEVEFIYGKFTHAESNDYLTVERRGRGRPLGPQQRNIILAIYNELVSALAVAKHFDASEMPRLAYTLLSKGRSEAPKENYSDILVDEVQDLSDMELRVLHAIEQVSGQLFLVGDGAQQIFRRGQSLRRIGIDVSGRSFILRKNYRNTAEITKTAGMLRAAEGIGRFDEDAAASQLAAIPSAVSGERPSLLICSNPEEERAMVLREIKYLINKVKIEPSHICCLARSAPYRTSLLSVLKAAGINARDYRANGDLANPQEVLISTLHNSKGHEFRVVFILGLNEGFIRGEEHEEVEREASLLYVAMTRAKDLLYLSYSKKSAAGKALVPSRFIKDFVTSTDVLEFAPTYDAAGGPGLG